MRKFLVSRRENGNTREACKMAWGVLTALNNIKDQSFAIPSTAKAVGAVLFYVDENGKTHSYTNIVNKIGDIKHIYK